MIDERDLLARFEAAGVGGLVSLLRGQEPGAVRALDAYLGPIRHRRLRDLAMRAAGGGARRSIALERRGAVRNVLVVPDLFGTELVAARDGRDVRIWPDLGRLREGAFRSLRLAAGGREPFQGADEVRAGRVWNQAYGDVLLTLAASGRKVRPFPYDWRKDLRVAAAELGAQARSWFGDEEFAVVAHGAGGLVARAMLRHLDDHGEAGRCRRLVLLGTPDGGTFEAVRLLAGQSPVFDRLARLAVEGDPSGEGVEHETTELRKVVNSFAAIYQLLPRPEAVADPSTLDPLYRPQAYAPFGVPACAEHLEDSRGWWDELSGPDPPDLVVRVVGVGRPTAVGLGDLLRLREPEGYVVTRDGDGLVPRPLAEAGARGSGRIYYVRSDHAGLAHHEAVLGALDDLLDLGVADRAGLDAEPGLGPSESDPIDERPSRRSASAPASREDWFEDLARRLRSRSARRAAATRRGAEASAGPASHVSPPPEQVSPDERALLGLLAGGFLPADAEPLAAEVEAVGRGRDRTRAAAGDREDRDADLELSDPAPAAPLVVELVNLGIEAVHDPDLWDDDRSARARDRIERAWRERPIDAIALGHYLGMRPLRRSALDRIDRSISRALKRRDDLEDEPDRDADDRPADPILRQYIERGIIRGELGQPFFLDDPRDPAHPGPGPGRVVVVAGMGPAGRFGVPELTVLVRELAWALARSGRRHLATLLIGSGAGNLSTADAVHGWLRGLSLAERSAGPGVGWRLERLTFVEFDPRRVLEIDQALRLEVEDREHAGRFDYTPRSGEECERLGRLALARDRDRQERQLRQLLAGRHDPDDEQNRSPTRVTMTRERDGFGFGALTETASIPQRNVAIDPRLVAQASAELVAEPAVPMQRQRGQFLGHLLIPDDLRPQFFTRDPLVLMLDAETARIPWEMVAQSDRDLLSAPSYDPSAFEAAGGPTDELDGFLGTCRGLTRQLRTSFAPPPEPPPPPGRTLRVLVVADPAADAPLPGAEQEGAEVADLFESYDAAHGRRRGGRAERRERVVVKRLFGPLAATPTNVLREVMSRTYDVLHFAGHCFFDPADPPASGWVFSGGQVLSAHELNRIDRVPRFVFSNACESGVTPDRPEGRSERLAPSFAEAFFARGVANFVCTAWPVDDLAARQFALRLYAGLLGLDLDRRDSGGRPARARLLPIFAALRLARRAIAATTRGSQTWGAYQHYGNPYFRFFPERPGSSD